VRVPDEFDVFVSYGHADQAWARLLAENLERAGLHVFYDEWEILPGDRLVHRLDAGIRGSRHGILIVSPEALARPWVAEEYAAMLTRVADGRQRLIPVLLHDADMPPFLASRVWVDFRHADDPAAYTRKVNDLVAALRDRRPSRPAPDGSVLAPPGMTFRAEGPRTAALRIGESVVVLTADGRTVSGQPVGIDWSAGQTLRELDRLRAHQSGSGVAFRSPDGGGTADSVDTALRAVGRMLGERLLPTDVAAGLATEVDAAVRGGVPLRLAVEIAEDSPGLADLPWEALTLPGDPRPLVLHPSVDFSRAVTGLGPTPALRIPGPLRILVVIASPERGSRELLDYEQELERIFDAVEPARRRSNAYVRVLNWGSRDAIRAALQQERFHVLHVSCHARPGHLVLETDHGDDDPVNAQTFAEEVLVPGRGVAMVVLAGCSTALTSRHIDAGDEGETVLPGLARGLLTRGVPAVVAMTAPVSDVYATAFTSRLYGELAGRAVVDPLAAFCDARRAVEAQRNSLPASDRSSAPVEWATPTLFLRGPALPLVDRDAPIETIAEPVEPVLAAGIVTRRVGQFVGRRGELRTLLRALRSPQPGVVLHGLGGVGKSTLAAQLVSALGDDAGLVIALSGPIAVDQILATIASRLSSWCLGHNIDESDVRRRLVDTLRSGQIAWAERLTLLAEHLLPTVAITLLLDNTEDTLTAANADAGNQFTDPQLAAFLAAWSALTGQARLVVISRFPLPVDPATGRRLHTHHLGPLSPAEARKLLWRLPALDALPSDQQIRAITDVGGHPRALEYLDALLAGGDARFPDIADALETALTARGIDNPTAWYATTAGDMDRALAETITLAVDDVLLEGLLARLDPIPHARRLLAGAAAYRRPVDETGLAWQIADIVTPATDPQRDSQFAEIAQLLRDASDADADGLADTGLSAAQISFYLTYVDEQQCPPLSVPTGFNHAVEILLALGLLTPAHGPTSPRDDRLFTVHRWTATAILARTRRDERIDAHRRAAVYWQWRVKFRPEDHLANTVHVLEAGHHHLEAGDHENVGTTTGASCAQLHTWGFWDWEEQVIRHTLTRLPPTGRLTAAFIHHLGIIAQARGDYTTAEDLYRQSLTLKENLGARAGVASSHHNLGSVAEARGDYATAEDLYHRALTLNEKLGDRAGVASSYHQLGSIAAARGDYTTAENLYQKSLALAEELGDSEGIASSHHQLGIIAQARGDYTTAEKLYRQSLTLKEKLRDRAGIASSNHQLGRIAELRGEYTTAENLYRKSLALAEQLGDRAGIAGNYHQLGLIAQARGDHATAEDRYRQSLNMLDELGDRAGIASSYHQLGLNAHLQGDYATAEDRYRRSLALEEELGNRAGIATSYHQLGIIAQEREDYATAENHYRRSLALEEELGNRAGIAASKSQLGALYTIRGKAAEAVPLSLTSVILWLGIGSPEVHAGLHWLRQQRQMLGDTAFHTILTKHLPPDVTTALMKRLDSAGPFPEEPKLRFDGHS
jgi:tetratricopeptide (TPR) repeat protein